MKILLAHFRVGETDGVSLEMDKWKYILEKNGHTCFYLSGNKSEQTDFVIPEMHYLGKTNKKFVDNCYKELTDYSNEETLKAEIFAYADKIKEQLREIILRNKIDLVIPNNIWSLGWHLPTGIAFTEVAHELKDVQFLAHNHDFYWERPLYSNPVCKFVNEILENYFMPVGDNIRHVVINKIAQEEVKIRKNIDAIVVPNVFDFEVESWKIDEFNRDLREKTGAGPNDIIALQATRISERKAIEFAILTIKEMNEIKSEYIGKTLYDGRIWTDKSKIHFVLAGLDESLGSGYFQKLQQKLNEENISFKHINAFVGHSRSYASSKQYSLWDSYTISDFVTYPSILEGWGNQLLEAMFARKPILYYEYPVFLKDLKDYGIEGVSLGSKYYKTKPLLSLDKDIVRKCARGMMDLLFDKEKYEKIVETNFLIGKKYFSYQALDVILNKALTRC